MNYQKILVGAAIGTAVAGVGFLLFHPSGKKFRSKAMDLSLDAADKLITYVRNRNAESQNDTVTSHAESRTTAVPGM